MVFLKRKALLWPIFFIVLYLLLSIFRVSYHSLNNATRFYYDSEQYLRFAREYARDGFSLNPLRQPLYPLFLKAVLPVTKDNAGIEKFDYRPVVWAQNIIGLSGLLVFMFISYRLFNVRKVFFIISSLLYGLNIHIFSFEQNIITESLMGIFLIFLIFSIMKLVDRQNNIYIIILTVVSVMTFFLHPGYVFLPPILFLIVAYYYKRQGLVKPCLYVLFFLAIYLIFPAFYIGNNFTRFGYLGLNTISQHNLYAKIIQYKLNTQEVSVDRKHDDKLATCVADYVPKNIIQLESCIGWLGIQDDIYSTKSAPIVGKYATLAIIKQPILYVTNSFALFPQILLDIYPDSVDWISTGSIIPSFEAFLVFLYKFYYVVWQKISLLFILFYPVSFVLFIRKPVKTNLLVFLTGTAVFYVLFISSFFSFINYFRLKLPAEGLMIIFLVYFLYISWTYIRRLVTKFFIK